MIYGVAEHWVIDGIGNYALLHQSHPERMGFKGRKILI